MTSFFLFFCVFLAGGLFFFSCMFLVIVGFYLVLKLDLNQFNEIIFEFVL